MTRKILLLLLFTITLTGCGGGILYNRPSKSIRTQANIQKNKLHLVNFFVNKMITWRAEAERYSAYFHDVDPLIELFSKEVLAGTGINLNRIDFTELVKQKSLNIKDEKDYIKGSKQVLIKDLAGYKDLFIHSGTAEDHYLLIETQLSPRVYHDDSLKLELEVITLILNSNAETVFYQYYSHLYTLSDDDRKKIFEWFQHNPRECEIRITEIYVKCFMALSEKIIADLQKVL